MSNKNIYQKRGNLNYKERKLIDSIKEKLTSNPEMESTFTPAQDFEELQSLHNKLTAPEVEFEEVDDSIIPEPEEKTSKPFIDPLNREEPNVRDYVMEDKFDPFADFSQSKKSEYSEPQNYSQAFDIPDPDDFKNENVNTGSKQQNQRSERVQSRPQSNSGSSDDSPKDRRKSKRFAGTVVNTICNLFEVGFVWYATKDINEQKLAEYEMSGEMDLSVLVELPDGSEATIKQFFLNQLDAITVASKIDKEKREDLIDALTELFIEKNIQPSASYDVALSGISLLAEQTIKLFMITSTNNSILAQLRERNAGNSGGSAYGYAPQDYAQPEPAPEPTPAPAPEPIAKDIFDNIDNELSLLQTIPTKE